MSKRALLVAAALQLGCGSDPVAPPTNVEDSAGVDDSAAFDTAPAEDGAVGAPSTPQIVSIVKMAGNLHVTWKNMDTGLSKIELLRKKDGGDYTVAYTYTKAVTNQHDVGAVAPGTFCYQVRTTRGALQSELSPEKCGAP